MSLVPYDLKLIDQSQLNKKEINQINWYSKKVKEEMLPRLEKVNDTQGINWLNDNTKQIN